MRIFLLLLIFYSITSLPAQEKVIISSNQNLKNVIEKLSDGATLIIKPGIYKVDNIKSQNKSPLLERISLSSKEITKTKSLQLQQIM